MLNPSPSTPTSNRILHTACALSLALATRFVAAMPTTDVRFIYQGPVPSAALGGALQGLEEANLQGRFLGFNFSLVQNPSPADTQATDTAIALFVAGDSTAIRSASASFKGKPVFNLAADDDHLRSACLPNVLHIPPSLRMKSDAEAQWQKAHPDTQVTAHAWHASFEKYAGLQLNNRFQKAQGRPMDDDAWAGWAAVKMAADSLLRSHPRTATDLLTYLRRQLTFDGQKGMDMNFRPDGQLRQVVLLVAKEVVAGEAPVRGVADPQNLDSLGVVTNCRGKKRK